MSLPVNTAHFVKITYHGATNTKPSRLSASWEGWPTQGNTVRKSMPYTSDRDDMARAAADLFCAWLSKMPGDDDPLQFRATGLTLAHMGNDSWALLVETTTDGRGKP